MKRNLETISKDGSTGSPQERLDASGLSDSQIRISSESVPTDRCSYRRSPAIFELGSRTGRMGGKSLNDKIGVYAAERRHHNKPPQTCSQAPVLPAKAGILKVGEFAHSTNVLPSPRRSGEGRNPEGPFAREKTIEQWRRACKGEMIEKGKWGRRDLYEGIA